MRAGQIIVSCAVALAGWQTPSPGQIATRPSEIYLAPFVEGPGKTTRLGFLTIQRHGISVGKPILNITNHIGDDDDPQFLPDSSALVFSSNRDGQQRDIYRYGLTSKQIVLVTRTPEDERAPAVAADGRTFTTIRGADSRLWRFNLDGSNPVLAWDDTTPVKAHVWLSATDLAVVTAEPGRTDLTLQLVDLGNRVSHEIDSRVGQSVFVRPGSGTIAYLRHEDDSKWIKEVDPSTRVKRGLTDTLDRSEAFGVTPTGTLIMAHQAKIYSWEEESDRWINLTNLDKSGIDRITGIAISPDNHWIAIVATPSATAKR